MRISYIIYFFFKGWRDILFLFICFWKKSLAFLGSYELFCLFFWFGSCFYFFSRVDFGVRILRVLAQTRFGRDSSIEFVARFKGVFSKLEVFVFREFRVKRVRFFCACRVFRRCSFKERCREFFLSGFLSEIVYSLGIGRVCQGLLIFFFLGVKINKIKGEWRYER